ncbi:hypothetical protein Tco_0623375 [Tanacetum coccineum]
MSTLNFADTHNMVAFFAKPTESEGFEQIVDFLNAHTIKYALTVNRTIYTSCIKQFWATVKMKTVNGEVQLQALVDGKKMIITEATVRRYLQLKDAKGEVQDNATALYTPTIIPTIIKTSKERDGQFGKGLSITATGLDAEQDREESLGEEDASKHGRIANIDAYEDIYLVNVHTDKDVFGINDQDDANDKDDVDMFGVNNLEGDEVVVESEAVAMANTASTIPVTTTKGILLQDPSESIITTTTIPLKDMGKGIIVKEPLNMKKKYQINIDEQEAIRLQAAFDEEIDADYQMDKQMQAEEQEELRIEKKSKLFVQLLEARKKHFAVKRAEEKRNRPPTRAQQRSIMCTYLKNMARWKPKDLKNKSFANIQELLDKAMKRVNISVDMDKELVEESSKKAEIEKEESSLKRAGEELKPRKYKRKNDVTIVVQLLYHKSLTLIDYKIYQEGKKSFFQIIRVDGKHQMYLTFGNMLKNFDKEDLEVLWSISEYGRLQQGLVKVMNWKLYDSCGVHCITMQSMMFYLLVEKKYPLTKHTLHQMFNDVKFQVDYKYEMAFELLRLLIGMRSFTPETLKHLADEVDE